MYLTDNVAGDPAYASAATFVAVAKTATNACLVNHRCVD
jgi:hypothetical protein